MMGYDKAGLYWCKSMKVWALVVEDKEHQALLVQPELDNLINMLLNLDL